jgi:hypothetical protein
MARISGDQILLAMQQMEGRLNSRLDVLHGRIDTLVDAVSDLRNDLATHRHDD